MLCAIPLTGAAKSIFVYYFEKNTGRQLVSEKGAIFKGRPSKSFDPLADAVSEEKSNKGFWGLVGDKLSGKESDVAPKVDKPDMDAEVIAQPDRKGAQDADRDDAAG